MISNEKQFERVRRSLDWFFAGQNGQNAGGRGMAEGNWLEEAIVAFVMESPLNGMGELYDERCWQEPLVGFSRGDDALYAFFKEDIGAFFWTPLEIMEKSFPCNRFAAEDLSVISWVLPQTEATRKAHRLEALHPSKRWTVSRMLGEEFNNHLRRYVESLLLAKGYSAVAPVLSPLWARQMSEKYGYASNWSERHAAFVGGLGTFGLSDGLITARGKSVRCGSVVAAVALPPTPRPYAGHQDYCLHRSAGKCGRCAARCPAGAISSWGHDKEKCRTYIRQVANPYVEKQYGLAVNACGLCQVGVPCESGIPGRRRGADDGSKSIPITA